MKYLFGEGKAKEILLEEVLENLPLRCDLVGLYETFCAEREVFCDETVKVTTVHRKFIRQHLVFFQAVDGLNQKDKKRFLTYFGRVKRIKATSAKLVQPQVVVGTALPVILETQVFDIKWGTSPHAAGFHSLFGDSFRFNNCFAERIRNDKCTTTDYETVHSIAKANTPK